MEQDKVNSSTTDLINAVRDIFAAEVAKDTGAAPQLKRVLTLLPELRIDPERPEATQLPGCRNLSRALDLGEAGPAAPVAAAIRDLEETLTWAQSARHTVKTRGTYFMENYAFSSLGLTGAEGSASPMSSIPSVPPAAIGRVGISASSSPRTITFLCP